MTLTTRGRSAAEELSSRGRGALAGHACAQPLAEEQITPGEDPYRDAELALCGEHLQRDGDFREITWSRRSMARLE